MKVLLCINGYQHVIMPSAAASALAEHLAHSFPVDRDSSGRDERWTPSPNGSLSISFISDEQLLPRDEASKQLLESLAAAERRWLEHYNRAATAEKRVKELEAQLAEIRNKVGDAS